MRSRPQKQIEQDIEEDEDIVSEVKEESSSVSANKKNATLIIVASIVLIFVCYYIFFSGESPQQQVLEPVTQISGMADVMESGKVEQVASKEEDKSIYNLSDIDKEEKNNIELLEKQAKPEIPDIPELPANVDKSELVDISKMKDNQSEEKTNSDVNVANVDPKLPNATPDSIIKNSNIASSEELKSRDQKIQELEFKLKEQQENQDKQKQVLIDEMKKNDEAAKLKETKAIEDEKSANDSIFEPRYSPIVVFSDRREGGSPPIGVGEEKNIIVLKEDDIKKIAKTEKNVEVRMIEDRSRTIAQGKLLSAILETSINTEFPGPVRGIITRDVYGEAGREILIPKGSRLYGTYSAEIKRGQGRVNISWSRLLRPDGISLSISLSASDQSGRAGIPGEADNRYSSLVANSLLASVLAVAGTAAAQQVMGGNTQTSTTINASQGTTTTFGNAGNQALADVTKTIIDIVTGIIKNTIDLNPVIRIPQGARMTVIVNNDIVVPYMRKNGSR
jgi:type IV secretory pathway VirB10-like protein